MKKTIVTVFSIIIVLVVCGIIANLATGGAVWKTILTAVAGPINKGWRAIGGKDADPLIDVEAIWAGSGLDDGKHSVDSVFGD